MGLLMHRHIVKQEELRKKAKMTKPEVDMEPKEEAQEQVTEEAAEQSEAPKKGKKSKKGE